MSVSEAIPGPGFLLDYDDGSGWTHIVEVGDISGPSTTTETVDVTNQDSDGGYREFKATLHDGGEVTFPSHFIPSNADQVAMIALQEAKTLVDFRIVVADSGFQVIFSGLFTNLGFSFPTGGVATMNVTIKVTGPIDSVAAS